MEDKENKTIFVDMTDDPQVNKFLKALHQAYNERVTNYYEAKEKELSRFIWSEKKKVFIYILDVFSDNNSSSSKTSILFAIPSKEDNKIFYANLVNETNNFTFGNIHDSEPKARISWLISQKILKKEFTVNIYNPSIFYKFFDFTKEYSRENIKNPWIKKWVDTEYRSSLNDLKKSNYIEPFPTLGKKLFVDRYHFDEMLKTLDDNQFNDEFNQCLFAYEHEKWFLCAAGLGSCLEHLMEKVIINYNKNGYPLLKRLGKDPTLRDYLNIFRKEPINLEPRQETYIKMLFMARNSVDHHNTGYTSKNICDSLLDGIRNIFNDYYSQSILSKNNSKGD